MVLSLARPILGAAILAATALSAIADEAASGRQALSLRDALARVYSSNPDLNAALLELPALDGRREQAGLPPNPALGLEVENFAGTGAVSGFEGAETTLALSQLMELGGKRGFRVGAVDAAYGLAESEIAVRRLDLSAEVLRRFVHAARTQELVVLNRRRMDLATGTLTAVETRVAAARAPAAELHRARAAVDRARLEHENSQRSLSASHYRLAALWGAEETGFAAVEADLYSLPQVSDFTVLLDRVRVSPEAARLLSESRLRDAELRLAEAQRRPDLTLSGGIRRLEQGDDVALVFSAEMPLTIFNRNQGAIREARVRREQADALQDASLRRATVDLRLFYEELMQARAEMEALRDQVQPELEEALRQTETAYQQGRYSYLELVNAQQDLIEVSGAIIEAAARYHTLLAEIERLTGEPLAMPSNR